ncbi:MAG: ABC transporter permease [Agathobacter sp.]|nr:ABC transporter permease [Agathobacter sp.]
MEINQLINIMAEGILETLYMTVVSTVLAYVLGIPLGVILFITDKDGIAENGAINKVLGVIVNLLRSVPFIILLVAILPFTRFVVGTTIGATATIVPLVVAAIPFVARMVESSLKEVNGGVIEAALSMGSNTYQIITKVLLPEAKPSLIVGSTIAITTILGYSAMAGFVGGGGLGAIAINYGYYRYQEDIMFITVILLVIVVQIFQETGMKIASGTDKRRR